jgi:hypothetical protein
MDLELLSNISCISAFILSFSVDSSLCNCCNDLYFQTAEKLKTIQKEVTSLTSTNIKLEQQNATKEREKGELLTQFMTLEDQKANLQNCNDALQLEVSTRMHN